MTVQELIDQLGQFEPTDEVHVAYGSGDYWKTTVAPKIHRVEYMPVIESAYHNKPMIIDEEDKRYDEAIQVVVIS